MTVRAKSSEAGFTVVEVVVATLILLIGSLALLSVVDASTRNTFRAEQSQVVVNQMQSELERIKQLPFAQVALTGTPSSSDDPKDPAWRVSGSQFALAKDGTSPRPLVVNGSALFDGGTVSEGVLSPSPTPFTSGDVTGTLRRYVVWTDDPKCPESLCPGAQDLKRVIVAGTIDQTASGGTRAYQELQSTLVDPDAEPVDNPTPPGSGQEGSFATFWLSDTSCDQSARVAPTADHLSHNTLGSCSDNLSVTPAPGAPDLMFGEGPPLDPSFPDDQQPIFDYATDVEPVVGAGDDKGLQGRFGLTPGCAYDPIADSIPAWEKVHRWLTPPIPAGKDLSLDGRATLNLWTRTINGANHQGQICVWLFVRRLNVVGDEVDVLLENKDSPGDYFFAYDDPAWPANPWTEVHIDMNLPSDLVDEGEQMGVAIGVEKGGTNPGDGLQMLYDHPSFDSRLELESSSPLPVFG